ncbi:MULTISPECIES: minor capsid protein [Methanohalophilus]|uniref:minor capsid protein n=1 Tax=Methanohalophilus TaxID=2175 RepID=UPI000BBC5A0F|nr:MULTISPECIES: minor capsid protein [Methanohalophilus]
MANNIKKYWINEPFPAVRFARTFTADVAFNSELYRYSKRGVQVEFFAEIDDRTSPQCRALHGTVFDANSGEASRMRLPQ